MRKDNSNNTAAVRSEKCRLQSEPSVGKATGKQNDETGHAESNRLDCTANIDVANSLSPRLPIEGDELH